MSIIDRSVGIDLGIRGLFYLFIFFFLLFRAAPVAYGSSQARDQIETAAAGQYHRHSNATSEPCLQPTPQLMATPDP